MIRLYGHLRGSFRTVTEGLKLAFEELGVLEGYYIGEQQDFDSVVPGGATAPIAVVTGDPLRTLMAHTQGDHRQIWLMLAPNSEGVPPQLKAELLAKRGSRSTVDGLLAPSKWAQQVLQREFPSLPVELCQHGVLPVFKSDLKIQLQKQAKPRDEFVILHLTSTRLGRKCTADLVREWVSLRESNEILGRLWLAVNPEYAEEFRTLTKEHPEIDVVNGQNYRFETLAMLYRCVDLVVQPSRAEGFGLVPLEALACGTPVVLTAGTGHLDYLDCEGIVPIEVGVIGESDDYWGATAPTVPVKNIRDALRNAYTRYEDLERIAYANSENVRERWTWTKGAKGVVNKWRREYVRTTATRHQAT